MNRRHFVASIGASMFARAAFGQQGKDTMPGMVSVGDSSNLFAMDQNAAKTVRKPPKPGATPVVNDDQRDAVEHRIRCQCGCTLDVYTCRTTDFNCRVSPAMHKDIMSLIAGGYNTDEIIAAFVVTYGERVLMAPPARGFNLVGYTLPFVMLGAAAVALTVFLRRASHGRVRVAGSSPIDAPAGASADEVARIQAALRRDDE